MYRPCILIADREFPGTISTRKLLLETAKFNVITAYSGGEAIDLVQRFPQLDAAVLDHTYSDISCEQVAEALKSISPKLHIIATTLSGTSNCSHIDRAIPSYDPQVLLSTVRDIFSSATAEILANEKKLSSE